MKSQNFSRCVRMMKLTFTNPIEIFYEKNNAYGQKLNTSWIGQGRKRSVMTGQCSAGQERAVQGRAGFVSFMKICTNLKIQNVRISGLLFIWPNLRWAYTIRLYGHIPLNILWGWEVARRRVNGRSHLTFTNIS